MSRSSIAQRKGFSEEVEIQHIEKSQVPCDHAPRKVFLVVAGRGSSPLLWVRCDGTPRFSMASSKTAIQKDAEGPRFVDLSKRITLAYYASFREQRSPRSASFVLLTQNKYCCACIRSTMHMCIVCDDSFAVIACGVLLCLCARATVHVMHAMRLHAQLKYRMLNCTTRSIVAQ